jgi:Spy/CpxP family protein refolding chaperone
MNRTLKVSLLIMGIFGCGVVVGAVGARRLAPPSPPPARAGNTHGAEAFGPHMMRRLAAELQLSAEQRAEIEPVIKRAGEELRILRRESMRESGAVIEAMEAAVSAQLTPEQREKFVAMKEAQKARIRAMMEERQRRRAEGGDSDRERDREPRPRPEGPPPAPGGG